MSAFRRFLRRHFPRIAARMDLLDLALPGTPLTPSIRIAWRMPDGIDPPSDVLPQKATFSPGMFRATDGILHINGPVSTSTNDALQALYRAAVHQLHHPEIDRWADDGGRCV